MGADGIGIASGSSLTVGGSGLSGGGCILESLGERGSSGRSSRKRDLVRFGTVEASPEAAGGIKVIFVVVVADGG